MVPMTVELAPFDSALYRQAVELRRRVLRLPLGLDFTPEDLAPDREQFHFVATDGGQVVGCLVMVPHGNETKMRQVAVEPDLQGRGIGKAMVAHTEVWAAQEGYESIVLHAREGAVPFYLGLGYELEGEPFEEVTIPHRRMRKRLTAPAGTDTDNRSAG